MPNRAKEERHSIPGEFENLGELAVPPPIQADDRRQHQGEPRLEQSTAQKTRWGNIYSDYEEKYNPPDEYENLDELKAPSLVESPHVERPQGYLEDRQSSTTHSVKRRDRDLPRGGAAPPEQSLSSSPTNLSHVEKHPHTRNTQVSRFATQLYTISHLIFFSILGTLARLGLQALTSYPGAPIQTGLLWAN
ncbi:MAG: hypothetical protein L6R39_004363, partial [Caloplaca ligustica]